jgi:hypothetical protein
MEKMHKTLDTGIDSNGDEAVQALINETLKTKELALSFENINTESIQRLEPTKLAKLVDCVENVKGILFGLGLLTAGGLAIAHSVIKGDPTFTAGYLNGADFELMSGLVAGIVGLTKTLGSLGFKPERQFN